MYFDKEFVYVFDSPKCTVALKKKTIEPLKFIKTYLKFLPKMITYLYYISYVYVNAQNYMHRLHPWRELGSVKRTLF